MELYGRDNERVVMLLHGGGLSQWSLRNVARQLEQDYCVVLPSLDGHKGSGHAFSSIEANAVRLIDWIEKKRDGRLWALGGLSLGGQVALEMLSRRPELCRYAVIESASVRPDLLTAALIRPIFGGCYGLVKKRWFARLQYAYLGLEKTWFEDYYRESCQISREDMIAFLKASVAYAPKASLAHCRAKTLIVAGGREVRRIRRSAEQLNEILPDRELRVLQGLRHGELSINDPERYTQLLRRWMEAPVEAPMDSVGESDRK